MKKNAKRIFASAAIIGMLSTGTAFADGILTITGPGPAMMPENTEATPEINGASVNGVEIKDVNGVKMMPLRQVAEGLGYQVEWNGENMSIEVTRGAQYIKMAIDKDSYAFSRRAGEPLGAAPTLVDDSVTYVPLAFVTEVLGGYYSVNEDGTYKIVEPSIVTVTSVNEDGSLTVADSFLGEVVVWIGEDTQILANGKEASVDMIKADTVLGIEYSDAMTASLPPKTTAVRINIENVDVEVEEEDSAVNDEEAVAFSGTVTEVSEDGVITIGEIRKDAVALVADENTVVTKDGKEASASDVKVGDKISGTRSAVETRSIPPQSVALTINID